MTKTRKPNRRLTVLRVGLFGASVGAIFFPSEYLPPFVAYEDLSNYGFATRDKLLLIQMVSWFILCAIPASCFALSLILKTYSRRSLTVLIPWTAVMLPTGSLAMALPLFLIFARLLSGLPFWPTFSVLVGSMAATIVGWCFLLRWPRYKEVTGDRPRASLLAALFGGGYVTFLALGATALGFSYGK